MKVLAVMIVLLALVVSIVPQFTDCESQGRMISLPNGKQISMKCHWAGRAEVATGLPLLLVGGMMVGSRRKESLRNLSILGLLLGAVAILLPTLLISVCADPTMVCNSLMKPILILSGGLVMAASAWGLFTALRQPEVHA